MTTRIFFAIFSFFFAANLSASEPASIVLFDGTVAAFESFEEKEFEGVTRYRHSSEDQGSIIAEADASASGLFIERTIDINTHPWLSWRWRVDQRLEPLDEKVKEGDDYAARLYVVVDGGLFFWKTIALNYVWSSNSSTDRSWPNAFAGDNAQMVALRGAEHNKEVWFEEKRNLKADFERYFDRNIDEIDGIAIMTDTDNSGGLAKARYGRIEFLSR